MLVKLTQNNEVAQYPYQFAELQADNPNTSFPSDLSAVDLSDFGAAIVEPKAPPAFNSTSENVTEAAPEFVGGKWTQAWTVATASAEERLARVDAFCRKIDADVDVIYAAVQGNRVTEYLIAESDATAYKAAGYAGTVPQSVACWATAKAKTSQWAADDILATAVAWRGAQSNIRAMRLACKETAKAASDLTAVTAQWAGFLTTVRSALGVS